MDKQPVGQLPDLTQSNNDDEIMVITNSEYNQLKKEKISDLITDFTSTNENNALTKGTDGKMFVTDFGNAANITEGTLPVSVLPDIPKDKLPEIETDDLPDSGITAGTYTYPTDIVINSKGQVTSITEGQAGANNANQDLSNLGPLGLDKLNQSKALETGSVSSDADVYADVQKYAHSTFDKSKFEVVGSPNITDDGIASGFSGSNYLTFNPIQLANYNSWEIITPVFNLSSAISGNFNSVLMMVYNNFFGGVRIDIADSLKLRIFIGSSSTTDSDIMSLSNLTVSTNTNYQVKVQFTGTEYIVWYRTENGSWQEYDRVTSSIKIYNALNQFQIGQRNTAVAFFNGSIDLKSFSITADGVPVFNGNKTGLYVAKSNNYEVVGSPTITEDGVASGFSASNYITKAININATKSIEVIFGYYFNNLTGGAFNFIGGELNGVRVFYGKYVNIWSNTGQLLEPYDYTSALSLLNGDFVTTSLLLTSNKIVAKIMSKGKTITREVDVNLTLSATSILIGKETSGDNYFKSILDLNAFKIYVDGNLIYQPCLKIPYTLSKTGSKIVDAVYRDRVQDLYEQTGEALYYTIDEENQNFTLPMADIYGMIENSRKGAMPVGTIFAHTCAADFVPENSLPCDGTEYSKSQFNNLYTDWLVAGRLNTCTYEQYQQDITTYGKCAKWGLDTTNQKFKVPTIPDGTIIQQAMTDDELGKSYNAGLPNIEGQIGAPTDTTYTEQSGALSRTTTGGDLFDRDASGGICTYSALIFDASLSNPIYGNSDTVQQNAVALRYFVVVATGSINQSLMDWSTWATGLQGKLNADHSNDTKPYITEAYVNDTSGYLVYSNGYCEQWGTTASITGNTNVITLLKEYINTNYNVYLTSKNTVATQYSLSGMPITVDTFNIGIFTDTVVVCWRTIGYIS